MQILVEVGEEQTKKVGIGNLRDLQVIAKKIWRPWKGHVITLW